MRETRSLSRTWGRLLVGLPILLVAVVAVGCSGDPTGPDMSQMMLTQPLIMVAGQVMNGQTMPVGHGDGASTLFQAHLQDGDGHPVTGGVVKIRYERPPGMGMMMGAANGEFRLYDDGTHGDPTAGDGIYCFEDWQGMYGCHANGLQPGEYCYEFWGEDHYGHQSNHQDVTVTLR